MNWLLAMTNVATTFPMHLSFDDVRNTVKELCAGDNMGDLFSAPKVQICRVVDKYLSSAPASELQDLEIRRQMSQVVSALVCFADHVLAAGTSAEYATKLLERMRQDSEDRKKAWQAKVKEKRKLCELES